MSIRPHQGIHPTIHPDAYVDPDASIIGKVTIGADSSVWPAAVLRGDVASITIGAKTSVQDGSVLHVTHDGPKSPGGRDLIIGDGVTVGHKVLLHACTIGNYCLIGMGAIVMDNVVVGDEVLIGAGSLVPPGKVLPPRTLWMGSPARQIRELNAEAVADLHYSANHYVRVKDSYRGS